MEVVRLEDISEIIAGQSPPSDTYNFEGVGLPFFQGKADFGELYPTIRMYCSTPNKIAKPNDILLSVRAPVGPTNLAQVESCIGRGLSAIRPNKKADTKFLLYYFRYFEKELVSKSRGSTFDAITQEQIRGLRIRLPDLKTQQEIAQVLEQADKARQHRKAANALTDQFLQSSFLSLFGDPVKNEKGWEVKRIGDMGIVKTGNTPSRVRKEYYGDYIEWIKTDNIKLDFMNPGKAEEYLSIEGLKVGRSVEKNSILVTCIAGSPNSIGNAILTDRKVAFNQQINSLTPSSDYDPVFVYGLFRQCKKMIQENTTKGMKRIITKSVFENIKFINPPLYLQQQFAGIVAQTEQLRQKQRESEGELEQLFQALLQKYFG